jgi:hypothetical protein
MDAYRPSSIKRVRPTKAAIETRRAALYDIIALGRPMTVRQVFYQASVRQLIEKTEQGYTNIGWDLTVMRKAGVLPYEWIEDGSRLAHKPATYANPNEALRILAEHYRKSLWDEINAFVEVWIEKDALTGVIYPVTAEYDVPLRPARGYASLSFLHDAACTIADLDKPAYVYHLGDFDPSGVNAGEKIEETLRELAPEAEIHFERLAVTEEQIGAWDLPSRPTKASDPRTAKFGSEVSVELDAIEPNQLRAIVREAIERHLPPRRFKRLKAAETRERARLIKLIEEMN